MQVRGISRPVLVALIAVAALLFVVGASCALSWVTHQTETHTRTLPAGSTISIEGRSGDIVVVGSDRNDVLVTTKERRSILGRPHVTVRRDGGRLRLDEHCTGLSPIGAGVSCSVRFRVEVPRDVSVRLVTRSGDVRAKDLRADADLQTSSGDVSASGMSGGRLRLRTISGDVAAAGSSHDIDAGTTSGDVHVVATDPVRVRAKTTSGDVHVQVPDRTYAVTADTQSGDKHADVRMDPRAPRRIEAATTSGDVHVSRSG